MLKAEIKKRQGWPDVLMLRKDGEPAGMYYSNFIVKYDCGWMIELLDGVNIEGNSKPRCGWLRPDLVEEYYWEEDRYVQKDVAL